MTSRAQTHEAVVSARQEISPHLVRLTLTGIEGFTTTGIPDEWVGLVVPGQFQSRYYTVRSWSPGDLVIDFFAGSNTTGAVAERLGRRWMSCELDRGYVAASAFRFLADPTLAPTILQRVLAGDDVLLGDPMTTPEPTPSRSAAA